MISLDDIRGLAALARLTISPAEEVSLQKDISSILDYVGQVSAAAVPTAGEAPALRNVLRADTPGAVLGAREALVAAFPKREPARPDGSGHSGGGDFNVVRKIVDKDAS